jgi:hypothetical protein
VAVITMSRPASAGELLQHRCQDLVTAEMARLSRRVPGLEEEHLGEVEAALCRVIDLLVSRAHAVSADQLTALFGLAEAR